MKYNVIAACCISWPMAGFAQPAGTNLLASGAYDVDVHFEMSYGEDKPERHTICLTDERTNRRMACSF